LPLMIALSYSLGWDAMTGLGMSILATNMGFSAAVINPFTVGVAQGIAELPAFSGAGYRIIIFLANFALLSLFLTRHARKVEKNPLAAPAYAQEQSTRAEYAHFTVDSFAPEKRGTSLAIAFLAACIALIYAVLIAGPFVPTLGD